MHKTLKQEIFRQKIRLIHKDAVRKNTIIEQATLYSTFVQPFTDVIDSAVSVTAAGIAEIEGRRLDVVTDGEYVPAQHRVKIVEARGNRILVRPVEG